MPEYHSREGAQAAAHDEGIWSVAWVPGTSQLLTGAVDETIKIWDCASKKPAFVHTLSGFSLGVVSLCVDPTGTYGAASSLDSNIRVWNMAGYETKNIIETTPTELWRIAFGSTTAEGMVIAAAGGSRHQVVVYNTSAADDTTETRYDLPAVRGARSSSPRRGSTLGSSALSVEPRPCQRLYASVLITNPPLHVVCGRPAAATVCVTCTLVLAGGHQAGALRAQCGSQPRWAQPSRGRHGWQRGGVGHGRCGGWRLPAPRGPHRAPQARAAAGLDTR